MLFPKSNTKCHFLSGKLNHKQLRLNLTQIKWTRLTRMVKVVLMNFCQFFRSQSMIKRILQIQNWVR